MSESSFSSGATIGKYDNFFEGFRCSPKKTSIKIVLLGDGAVGKTSFFDRITTGDNLDYKFRKTYDATTGCNICQMDMKIGKYTIKLHMFDTAGQEKFGSLRDSYLMGADGIIMMYDLNNKSSRQNILTKWLPDLKKHIDSSCTKSNISVAVVGNKSDRIDEELIKKEKLYLDSTTCREVVGLRKSVLKTNYSSTGTGSYPVKSKEYGQIEHFYSSVKQDEGLMDPINWLLKDILCYYISVDARKTSSKPVIVKTH
jgi:small GTP-binding protein